MTEASVTNPVRANRDRRAVLARSGLADLSPRALAVLAAVPEWWRRRVACAGLHTAAAQRLDLAIEADPMVDLDRLAQVPYREDLVSATPEALAEAYVVALDDRVRSADGRHYTPPAFAEALYEQAVGVLGRSPSGLVWDPACGAGALLVPALRDYLVHRADTEPDLLLAAASTHVGGRDLDAAAAWLGNVLLAAELLPVWASVPPRRRRPLPAMLEVGDGLTAPPTRPELIVTNPPYGRVRLGEDDRERWAHVLYGHANRYSLFLG
ncbi:MAG TPA: hypothetical protein VEL73_02365, partial [Mycobacteriales bacterium]|nr:hypothetical protein [Mycobacteriales bacterium]